MCFVDQKGDIVAFIEDFGSKWRFDGKVKNRFNNHWKSEKIEKFDKRDEREIGRVREREGDHEEVTAWDGERERDGLGERERERLRVDGDTETQRKIRERERERQRRTDTKIVDTKIGHKNRET